MRFAYCRPTSDCGLRLLHKVGEILGARLNTIHNLYYYQLLMQSMRAAIENGEFETFKTTFKTKRAQYASYCALRGLSSSF